jgi:hypothetical protein
MPVIKLRERGVYELPDGRELIVGKISEQGAVASIRCKLGGVAELLNIVYIRTDGS